MMEGKPKREEKKGGEMGRRDFMGALVGGAATAIGAFALNGMLEEQDLRALEKNMEGEVVGKETIKMPDVPGAPIGGKPPLPPVLGETHYTLTIRVGEREVKANVSEKVYKLLDAGSKVEVVADPELKRIRLVNPL